MSFSFKLLIPFLVVLSSFILAGCNIALAEEAQTDRIVVKYKQNVSESKKEEVKQGIVIKQERKIEKINVETIEVGQDKLAETLAKLSKDPNVEYAEPDYIATSLEIPNDTYFNKQWALPKIQAPGAWDKTVGSGNVLIAVVDTGIDPNHPDLSGKIVSRANFTFDSDTDGSGHGSHVAGIIAASSRNSQGIAGTCLECRLISVKVLDSRGQGYYSWISNGIVWASDNGAKIINLSLGGSSSQKTLQDAVNYAHSKGVLMVAAAGNNGSKSLTYPAAYEKVIATASTDSSDKKSSFSNYGTWVDLAAPGSSIYSTYKGDYTNMSGTSMASPHVAGLAGLVLSQNPGWSSSQIRSKLESTADKISKTGTYWTFGRINACKAVGCSSGSSLEETPSPSPSPSPSVSPSPQPSPSPSPSSSPSSKPKFCKYIPTHSLCQ